MLQAMERLSSSPLESTQVRFVHPREGFELRMIIDVLMMNVATKITIKK